MKEMTYEQAMSEIKRIVEKLESDNQEIDGIIANVKQAAKLIAFCKNKLHGIETELEDLFTEQ
ncbi:MAG: exodeoxyribonuclease VII small subunit [Prevotellaceae bacterium]|jgi:exodeoxyribonuclease VII small subunit|nr:exodeoxyribonuclease VII small subunit [Prevotellaceae bacterium]